MTSLGQNDAATDSSRSRTFQWTLEDLQAHMRTKGLLSKAQFMAIFDWDEDDFKEAKILAFQLFAKHGFAYSATFRAKVTMDKACRVEQDMYAHGSMLFVKRQSDSDKPRWWYEALHLTGRNDGEDADHPTYGVTIGNIYLRFLWSIYKKSNFQSGDDNNNDEAEPNLLPFVGIIGADDSTQPTYHHDEHNQQEVAVAIPTSSKARKRHENSEARDGKKRQQTASTAYQSLSNVPKRRLYIVSVYPEDEQLLLKRRSRDYNVVFGRDGSLVAEADVPSLHYFTGRPHFFWFQGDTIMEEEGDLIGFEEVVRGILRRYPDLMDLTVFVADNIDHISRIPEQLRDFSTIGPLTTILGPEERLQAERSASASFCDEANASGGLQGDE